MQRKIAAIITIIILVLTIAIYYYTNNLENYAFGFKAFVLFFIGYCSLYVVWLYKDILNNSKLIYKTGAREISCLNVPDELKDLERKDALPNELPHRGHYYEYLGLIVVDINNNILFTIGSMNQLCLPLIKVGNMAEPDDKIEKMFNYYTGKAYKSDDVVSSMNYIVHKPEYSRYNLYYIYRLRYALQPNNDNVILKNIEEVRANFGVGEKSLFNQGTQYDLDKILKADVL
jgi:hypothetical protein